MKEIKLTKGHKIAIVSAVVLGMAIGGYIFYNRLTSSIATESTTESSLVSTESTSKKSSDKVSNNSSAKVSESTTIESTILNEEAYRQIEEEQNQKRREAAFKTNMSESDLQARLSVPVAELNWEGISMTKAQYDEWLSTLVPKYLDNIYTVNRDEENKEMVVAVIGDQKETDEVESKLANVLHQGLAHSEYQKDGYTTRFYSGLIK